MHSTYGNYTLLYGLCVCDSPQAVLVGGEEYGPGVLEISGPLYGSGNTQALSVSDIGKVSYYVTPYLSGSIDNAGAALSSWPAAPRVLPSPPVGPSGLTGPTGPTGATGPSGAASSTYVYTQMTPNTLWTVNHNLGFNPSVSVFNAGGMFVEVDYVHTSPNQTVIGPFSIPFAGFARFT